LSSKDSQSKSGIFCEGRLGVMLLVRWLNNKTVTCEIKISC